MEKLEANCVFQMYYQCEKGNIGAFINFSCLVSLSCLVLGAMFRVKKKGLISKDFQKFC